MLNKMTIKQQGFSLVMTLVLFAALMVIGLSVMNSGILSEKQSANIQEKSVTFHAAQSTNNSTIESYRYNRNILEAAVTAAAGQADMSAHTQASKTCLDSAGKISTSCDSLPTLDAQDGVLKASTNSYYRSCLSALKCSGNSAGMFSENSIGCNVFQHQGTGFLDQDGDDAKGAGESQTQIEQWSVLVSACEKNN